MRIESAAFAHQERMPRKYTCEGRGVSPPLAWSEAPTGTQSYVLIIDDPDAPDPAAPRNVWDHWLLYDIPPSTTSLEEGAATGAAVSREGKNGWGRTGYGAPCPPIGSHRYFHKIYALDTLLGDLATPTKARLEEAMKGHVLASAELIGTYEKQKR